MRWMIHPHKIRNKSTTSESIQIHLNVTTLTVICKIDCPVVLSHNTCRLGVLKLLCHSLNNLRFILQCIHVCDFQDRLQRRSFPPEAPTTARENQPNQQSVHDQEPRGGPGPAARTRIMVTLRHQENEPGDESQEGQRQPLLPGPETDHR